MQEKRRQTMGIPLFTAFNTVFIVVISALVLLLIILYYSFVKKVNKSGYIEKKVNPARVSKFIELPHGQSEEIKDNTPFEQDRIYYSIVSKIFTLGSEFHQNCNKVAINGNGISFTNMANKLRLGIFTLHNLSVISNTFLFFNIPIKNSDKKTFTQLITVDYNRQPLVIHFFEEPKFVIKEWKSNIKFCGVFYKMIKYENKQGKEISAPLFLTYTVDKFSIPQSSQSPVTMGIISLLIISIIGIFFILHKAKMNKLYMEKLENFNIKKSKNSP